MRRIAPKSMRVMVAGRFQKLNGVPLDVNLTRIRRLSEDSLAYLFKAGGYTPNTLEDRFPKLAGEKPPEIPRGSDQATRQKARDAWTAWWKDNAAKVNLAKVEMAQRLLGLTLGDLHDLRLRRFPDRLLARLAE